MADLSNAITNTISISSFNKGQAGHIFNDVKKSGTKIVMKNNKPECILISPVEYLALMEELNDARLIAIANQRLNSFKGETISEEEMDSKLGIKKEDLVDFDDVELE